MGADIISDRLEVGQNFLGLIDDGLVLENRAVVGEVDSGRLRRELTLNALSVSMTLAEGLEGSNGF